MNKKVYQLVEHTETAFKWYGLHEALIDKNKDLYWVGSQAIRKFDSYHDAVEFWAKVERNSPYLDILDSREAEQYYDKLEYTDEEELNFDD